MREHTMPTGLHRAVQPPVPLLDLIVSIAPTRPGTVQLQQLTGQEAQGAGGPSFIRRALGAQRFLKEAGFSPSLFPNRSAQVLRCRRPACSQIHHVLQCHRMHFDLICPQCKLGYAVTGFTAGGREHR